MGTQSTAGFTIIESMLFLAITGALIVGVIVGTGATIGIQRYRDAAETFKSVLQEQYASLSSVQNSRDSSWSCDATARPVEDGSEQRGQSGCMMVGRYLRIEGSDIAIYNVLARSNSGSTGVNDIQRMKNGYIFNVDTTSIDKKTMEWGAALAWPSAGAEARTPTSPRSIGIFIVRSPDSGQIYTFTNDTVPTPADTVGPSTFSALLVAGDSVPGQAARTLCVASNGLFVSNDQAVYLAAAASGASAVERRSNDYMAGLGVATRC